MIRQAVVVAVLIGGVVALSAQTSARRFEVASIKRNDSGAPGFSGGLSPGGRFNAINTPTARLIRLAYPTAGSELIGAPEWVTTERYDVVAIARPDTTRDEMQAMVRTLLEERFKLTLHRDTRERPTFSLALASSDGRLGPEMRRSDYDCAAVEAANRSNKPIPPAANGAPPCGVVQAGGTLRAGGVSMSLLAQMLSAPAGRLVVDKTGLSGAYEFTLRFSEQAQSVDDPPLIFTALQEQLGLKLMPDVAPVEVLVIDSVERPTPN